MRHSTALLAVVVLSVLQAAADPVPITGLPIAPVWSGHSVGFALFTAPPRQFVAFYDTDRHMTVAQRDLDSPDWTFARLPEQLGWDSHNSIVLTRDADGHLHLAGNMHVHPLRYFRTGRPDDITSLVRVPAMVGALEDRVTYPQFLTGPDDALIFTYRDGGSGRGNQIYNQYDTATRTWSRLLDTPLTDGEGKRNAYFDGPHRGPDGRYHLCWVWRDTPDCATNHSLSYARSPDLRHWERSDGTPLALPITLATGEIVDPVPPGGGLINGNARLGFDDEHRPILSYHKFDENGHTQIYNARLEHGVWIQRQASAWDYRWEFSGGGTIHFEIGVQPVRVVAGRLEQAYRHAKAGGGRWLLDSGSLAVVDTQPAAPPLQPAALRKVQSDFPGMRVHWRADSGSAETPGHTYQLRWESLGPNRDKPRDPPWPAPSPLTLHRFATTPAED